jgi:hypothetical protein
MWAHKVHYLNFRYLHACSWDTSSYGYHGDDGKKYHGSGTSGQQYSEPYNKGAVIGAGYHLQRQEIFFTCATDHFAPSCLSATACLCVPTAVPPGPLLQPDLASSPNPWAWR